MVHDGPLFKILILSAVITYIGYIYFPWIISVIKMSGLKENNVSCINLCPVRPADLKEALVINLTAPRSLNAIATMLSSSENFASLQNGGHYKPAHCQSREKVAILVPYRNRPENLLIFLNHMHPFLMRQLIEYRLFIVEQTNETQFNRAMLFNAGFMEALRMDTFNCFIFHDVDFLPENDENLYNCPSEPRHMSVSMDFNNYKPLYEGFFGGVSALTTVHFIQVNGYSNAYWGWGAEDDDMANRIAYHKLNITRRSLNIARYTTIRHPEEKRNPDRFKLLKSGSGRFNFDGLSNLSYTVEAIVLERLYTLIRVQLIRP